MDVVGQMQLFVKVVELGGFTAAARDLGLPKSSVSRQVARLEDRLGVRLLERTTRALRTTEIGQTYFERAQRIVGDIEEAEASVSRAQSAPVGTLRMSAPYSFGTLYMGALVAAFHRRHPRVQVDLSLADRKVDLVDEGYDLAVRVGTLSDSSMIARRLGVVPRVICGSPAYLEKHGVPQTVEDLRDHVCLQYAYHGAQWRLGPDQVVPIQSPLISNNGDVLRDAAVAGLGLVLSPRFIVGADLRAGRLVPVLEGEITEEDGIWAIYPHGRHLTTKVRSFVDFAVDYLADPPWELGPSSEPSPPSPSPPSPSEQGPS